MDNYPTLEYVFVFFLKSLIKLKINTVASFLNFCQWRIFTVNRSCYLELHGILSWTRIVFQSGLCFHYQYWNLLRIGLKCFMTRADLPSCCFRAPVGHVWRTVCFGNQQTPSFDPCTFPCELSGIGRALKTQGWGLVWALGWWCLPWAALPAGSLMISSCIAVAFCSPAIPDNWHTS